MFSSELCFCETHKDESRRRFNSQSAESKKKKERKKNQFAFVLGDSGKLFPRSRMMTATQGQCGIYSAHGVVGLFLFFSSQCTVSNERQPRGSQCAAAPFKRRRVALLTARSASSERFDFQGNTDLFFSFFFTPQQSRRGSILCFFRK